MMKIALIFLSLLFATSAFSGAGDRAQAIQKLLEDREEARHRLQDPNLEDEDRKLYRDLLRRLDEDLANLQAALFAEEEQGRHGKQNLKQERFQKKNSGTTKIDQSEGESFQVPYNLDAADETTANYFTDEALSRVGLTRATWDELPLEERQRIIREAKSFNQDDNDVEINEKQEIKAQEGMMMLQSWVSKAEKKKKEDAEKERAEQRQLKALKVAAAQIKRAAEFAKEFPSVFGDREKKEQQLWRQMEKALPPLDSDGPQYESIFKKGVAMSLADAVTAFTEAFKIFPAARNKIEYALNEHHNTLFSLYYNERDTVETFRTRHWVRDSYLFYKRRIAQIYERDRHETPLWDGKFVCNAKNRNIQKEKLKECKNDPTARYYLECRREGYYFNKKAQAWHPAQYREIVYDKIPEYEWEVKDDLRSLRGWNDHIIEEMQKLQENVAKKRQFENIMWKASFEAISAYDEMERQFNRAVLLTGSKDGESGIIAAEGEAPIFYFNRQGAGREECLSLLDQLNAAADIPAIFSVKLESGYTVHLNPHVVDSRPYTDPNYGLNSNPDYVYSNFSGTNRLRFADIEMAYNTHESVRAIFETAGKANAEAKDICDEYYANKNNMGVALDETKKLQELCDNLTFKAAQLNIEASRLTRDLINPNGSGGSF